MGLQGWLRAFSKERGAATGQAAFSRAAAAGDSLPRLLELAAGHLLTITRADRAGVWLESTDPAIFRGVVLDLKASALPMEWRQLELSTFPWKSVFRATTPVIADIGELQRHSAAGDSPPIPAVLAGMEGAVWWPVRAGGGAIGLVLLAFTSGRRSVSRTTIPLVWAFLDQLALAFRAHREREALESLRQEQTQQTAAELRALLDAVECGVLLLDASGRVRALNQRLVQLFGLEGNAVVSLMGCDVEQLLEQLAPAVRDPETFGVRWRELASLGNSSAWEEVELVRPAGQTLQRYSTPISDAHGRPLGWLELFHDPAWRGQAPSHLRLLQTEKMAAIGQLVSGIAHELNNPLTSILGYAQLLLARCPSSRVAAPKLFLDAGSLREILRAAEKICMEAERAGRIVKNLLLFARGARAERRAVSLNEVVERTLALRSYELKIENIHMELALDSTLPPCLADPHQMQQVVLNLLVNAEQAILESHAAEAADADVSSELGKIRVRTFPLPDASPPRVALEISDSGPGVPPQIASRLFDPFFTTKATGLGTGLGLSIAYGIVHDHGGDIYLLDSEQTSPEATRLGGLGGATLVVELPVFTAVETAAGHPSAEDESAASVPEGGNDSAFTAEDSSAATRTSRARILVVEDEPTVAQLIADVLEEDGHMVEVVLDSREGLARASRLGYDLIICDLRMPRIDGRAFYRSLVHSGHPAHLRILFITGDTLSPRTHDFLGETGLPCLAKPFLVEELKSIVYRALDSMLLPKRRFSGDASLQDFDPFAALTPHKDARPSALARRAEEARKP
jgi:two-component system NtrC family sensor kinase